MNKKDMFYIIMLILTFITVMVGAAFALYAFIFNQEEGTSAVYTGTLAIDYLSGNIINCDYFLPIESPKLESDLNIYKNNFKVSNTGSLDSLLEITIDYNVNEFSNDTLMYSLYNEFQEELFTGYLNGKRNSIIASNILLEHNTTAEFMLVIWLQDNGENQNTEMKKLLNGTIRVDASQKIE